MRKALLVAALILSPRAARAQADEFRPGPWYGWQLMLADAAAVTLLAAPVSPGAGPVARGLGMTSFLMNGPVIHMAHRNPRSASYSLLRLPLLLIGRMAGATAGAFVCRDSDCQRAALVIGEGVGLAPVLIFDWTSARRPARSYYAGAPPRLPPARLDGWAVTVPVVVGAF